MSYKTSKITTRIHADVSVKKALLFGHGNQESSYIVHGNMSLLLLFLQFKKISLILFELLTLTTNTKRIFTVS